MLCPCILLKDSEEADPPRREGAVQLQKAEVLGSISHLDVLSSGRSEEILTPPEVLNFASKKRGITVFVLSPLIYQMTGSIRKAFRSGTKLKMDIKSMKNYLYWLYCQFELITCSYLMEPWEKVLFYTFNFTMLVMVLYTTYIFVPVHISTAFQFFLHLFGNQHENTVSVVK